MKSDLKAKFLTHLVEKKKDEGFTLIELLVVIIIIGILSAIALPSFLNQANRARESEAASYVGTTNRGQQAYFLSKLSFTTDWGNLELGFPTETSNYKYELAVDQNLASGVTVVANPTNATVLRRYGGRTWADPTAAAAGGSSTTRAILCRSVKANAQMTVADLNQKTACTGNAESTQ